MAGITFSSFGGSSFTFVIAVFYIFSVVFSSAFLMQPLNINGINTKPRTFLFINFTFAQFHLSFKLSSKEFKLHKYFN